MVTVCIPFTNSAEEQKNWDYLLSNFKPDHIYVIGKEGDTVPNTNVLGKGKFIYDYEELPKEKQIVFFAPKNGRYIQGNINLKDYVHPEDVIYIVGPNHTLLTKEDFGNLKFDAVYIETDTKDDMFNHIAMTVALYDRRIKEWQTK